LRLFVIPPFVQASSSSTPGHTISASATLTRGGACPYNPTNSTSTTNPGNPTTRITPTHTSTTSHSPFHHTHRPSHSNTYTQTLTQFGDTLCRVRHSFQRSAASRCFLLSAALFARRYTPTNPSTLQPC
jgi:hypothetical protein